MSSRTGGISRTAVAEPPHSNRGGGVTFMAVAEVQMLPPMDDEEKLIAQASGQHVVDNTDPGDAPAILSASRGDTLVSKPEMQGRNPPYGLYQ